MWPYILQGRKHFSGFAFSHSFSIFLYIFLSSLSLSYTHTHFSFLWNIAYLYMLYKGKWFPRITKANSSTLWASPKKRFNTHKNNIFVSRYAIFKRDVCFSWTLPNSVVYFDIFQKECISMSTVWKIKFYSFCFHSWILWFPVSYMVCNFCLCFSFSFLFNIIL